MSIDDHYRSEIDRLRREKGNYGTAATSAAYDLEVWGFTGSGG